MNLKKRISRWQNKTRYHFCKKNKKIDLADLFPDDVPEPTQLIEDDEPKDVNSYWTGSNIFEKVPPEFLSRAISEHNADFPPGQETVYKGSEDFHGFIRVQLNLRRPINVLPGTRWANR